VFLAGDAAHLTPPFAGQGLVAGLRDAVNLAWKLAWVLRGRAAPGILDSYDKERRPHAVKMIALARRAGWLVAPRSRLRAWIVHGAIAAARKVPPVRSLIDELGIKPANAYAEGLFRCGPGGFVRGSWFPQGRVHASDGAARLSDDVLGSRIALVTLGARRAPRLAPDAADAWAAVGGTVVDITTPGTPARAGAAEDVERAFTAAPSGGWCVVVRPDRTILHDGPAIEADRIVRESVSLLNATA
jgi:3-(3-hydroxy-phenyl)propionate hydroxylase